MDTYTVIGFYEETGQIFVDHVEAKGTSHAFFVAAEDRPEACFVSAQKGALCEGEGLTLAGDSYVDGETIREQPEVFDVEDGPESDSVADPAEVPAGYALVPIQPTTEMLDEIRMDVRMTDAALKVRYEAVLDAAKHAAPSED